MSIISVPISCSLSHQHCLIISRSDTAGPEPWHRDLRRQKGHVGHLLHNGESTNDQICRYTPTLKVCHQSFGTLWFIFVQFSRNDGAYFETLWTCSTCGPLQSSSPFTPLLTLVCVLTSWESWNNTHRPGFFTKSWCISGVQ